MAAKKDTKEKTEDFIIEDAFQRLEAIIKSLEDPETKLNEAMELYKEGVVLSDKCRISLEGVEKEIKVLNAEEA